VDIPAALLSHLARLASSIELDPNVLQAPLKNLVGDLRAAIPSYRGLHMIILHTGQPVTLTDLLPAETDGVVRTSLRVPLGLLGPDDDGGSRVTFYAGTPGSLVDLAADLSYALKASVTTVHPDGDHDALDGDGQAVVPPPRAPHLRLLLDADLPPKVEVSGLTGLAELSAINRAVGILIDRGHTPDDAYDILRRAAAAVGKETHVFAARILRR
jgi:hypothetical protein